MVDFGIIEPAELARNCITRGGKVEVKSEECTVQAQRELTTLMVIYTSPGDIPPTPREPAEDESDDYFPEQAFGSPSEETRAREKPYYASQSNQYQLPAQPTTTQPQTPDISNLLKLLNTQQQAQPQQVQIQQITSQPASTGLEAIFAQYSNNQQQAPQSHVPQMSQQQNTSSLDLSAALAAITQHNNTRSAFSAPVPPAPSFDLGSLMAQIQQGQHAQPMQGFAYGNSFQSEGDRKRPVDFEDQSNSDPGHSKGKRQKVAGEKKKVCTGESFAVCLIERKADLLVVLRRPSTSM